MRNIEFKAELRDGALARTILRAIQAAYILTFGQTDTYYRVTSGRLKRRETDDEPAEWISYDRANVAGPRASEFTILTDEQALERYGREALPVWVVVRKRREVWMLGGVRVHLDEVDGLGSFLELEALVTRDHTEARARAAVEELRRQLGPALGELIDRSYSDMAADERERAAR
ncbi:MAG: class IV adenylate cyclase [Planctomycetota bacterium]|nr:class IV adenylate cyclase [Planctomycetota bacterium]